MRECGGWGQQDLWEQLGEQVGSEEFTRGAGRVHGAGVVGVQEIWWDQGDLQVFWGRGIFGGCGALSHPPTPRAVFSPLIPPPQITLPAKLPRPRSLPPHLHTGTYFLGSQHQRMLINLALEAACRMGFWWAWGGVWLVCSEACSCGGRVEGCGEG